jgi:hypothetical protein
VSQSSPAAVADQALMADYVQHLPAGSRVRVERRRGVTITGTLMQATSDAIVVQENSKTPRAPVTVLIPDIARVTLDKGHSTALKIWAGVGVAFTCLYVFSAVLIASAEAAR